MLLDGVKEDLQSSAKVWTLDSRVETFPKFLRNPRPLVSVCSYVTTYSAEIPRF